MPTCRSSGASTRRITQSQRHRPLLIQQTLVKAIAITSPT